MLLLIMHKGWSSLFSNNHLKIMFLYYMRDEVKSAEVVLHVKGDLNE